MVGLSSSWPEGLHNTQSSIRARFQGWLLDSCGGGGQKVHNPQNQVFALDFGGDCRIVVGVAARGSPQPPKSSVHTQFHRLQKVDDWIVIVVVREAPQPPKSSIRTQFRGLLGVSWWL